MKLISDRAVADIEVTAEVSLGNRENCEQIQITITPDVVTMLPRVKNLIQRIHVLARGMMLRELADNFTETGMSGVFPEYKHETVQAHAVISVPGGIIADLNGIEVIFTPNNVAETAIFEHEKVEQAKNRLVLQLLTDFATLGGH